MALDIRWKQRLQNFDRAVTLLREPIAMGVDTLSTLEKEGMIQRFEVALELGWKTLKDYLEFAGVTISPVTPRNVIKEAFAAKILPDAQVWLDMLDHRNVLSHTYDAATFEEVVNVTCVRYMPAIESLHDWLTQRRDDA